MLHCIVYWSCKLYLISCTYFGVRVSESHHYFRLSMYQVINIFISLKLNGWNALGVHFVWGSITFRKVERYWLRVEMGKHQRIWFDYLPIQRAESLWCALGFGMLPISHTDVFYCPWKPTFFSRVCFWVVTLKQGYINFWMN